MSETRNRHGQLVGGSVVTCPRCGGVGWEHAACAEDPPEWRCRLCEGPGLIHLPLSPCYVAELREDDEDSMGLIAYHPDCNCDGCESTRAHTAFARVFHGQDTLKPRRILVCGGRDFKPERRHEAALMLALAPGSTLIHGAARGCDLWAMGVAAKLGDVAIEAYPASWRTHGRSAGPIRNRRMLHEGRPDLVLAFPGGRGTAHMVEIARRDGIPVQEVA